MSLGHGDEPKSLWLIRSTTRCGLTTTGSSFLTLEELHHDAVSVLVSNGTDNGAGACDEVKTRGEVGGGGFAFDDLMVSTEWLGFLSQQNGKLGEWRTKD